MIYKAKIQYELSSSNFTSFVSYIGSFGTFT